MPFYLSFEDANLSFSKERRAPSEFDAALGTVLMDFQELEAVIRVAVAVELRTDGPTASIVTVELSFKKLVHVLGALIRHRAASDNSDAMKETLARWGELAGCCFLIEDMRNRLIHSFWPSPIKVGQMRCVLGGM